MNTGGVFNAAVKAPVARAHCLEFIRKHNVSFNEFEILNLIVNRKSITPAEISEILRIERAIVSRKLRTLANKYYVVCDMNSSDRRKINIKITKQGKHVTKELLKAINKRLDDLASV